MFPNRIATAVGVLAFGCVNSLSSTPNAFEVRIFNDPGGLPRWKITITATGILSTGELNYDSGWTTLAGGGFPSRTVTLEFDGLQIKHRCGQTARLIWSECRVKVGTTTVATIGAKNITYTTYVQRHNFYRLTPEVYTAIFPNVTKTGTTAPFNTGHVGTNGGIWPQYVSCAGEGACPPFNNYCRSGATYTQGVDEVTCQITLGYTDNTGTPPTFNPSLMSGALANSCDNVISYDLPSVANPASVTVEHRQRADWKPRLDESTESCSCPAVDGFTLVFSRNRTRNKWRDRQEYLNTRSAIMLTPEEGNNLERSTYRWTKCTPSGSTVTQVDDLTDTTPTSRVDAYKYVAIRERWCETVTDAGSCIYSPNGPYPGFSSNPTCPALPASGNTASEIGGHSVYRNEPPCVNPFAPASLSLDVDKASIIHVAARIEDDTIRLGLASNQLSWTWADTGIAASWVALRIDRWSQEQAFLMVYEDAGSVKLRTSTNKGESWSVATDIATGTKPMVLIGMNGTRHLYWADADKIKGQLRDRNDAVIETTFDATTGVDDGETFAVDEDVTGTGERRVHLVCVKGGNVTHLNSSDGKTFS